MEDPKPLTDVTALQQHRDRATALFLQEMAADEIQDRLSMVNRSFTSPAVVTPFRTVWEMYLPQAVICPEADHLALETGAHDLVVHAMGLHWANDPVGQLIQCRRALKPDGMLLAATLGGQTLQELRSCLAQAEIALCGGLSPRIAPMGEIRDLGALLQRAGLALPVADSLTLTVEYRDTVHLMHDLRAMGEGNALVARSRTISNRQLFDETSRLYIEHFATGSGRLPATFEIVFLTGWAPDESQQKPLRPGSAKQRLADALSVPETPLPD
ncbi:methyltransferase domain-containing protein [Roseobacter sinensis]|uniref:Methyltransferase domain-containing protein n=1 Tax=Roseobacter sinensis TaxID=2931391 RepID=A0ABT3B8Z7_9RHOB|nr:methyltransferase domain-containing protein [Roseobacter sp. WL0113]MCV3270043.1 methyltransferase domain-containing protein [Roseobacter sp. WL0113]